MSGSANLCNNTGSGNHFILITTDEFESANEVQKVKFFLSFQNHDIIPTVRRRIIGKSPIDDLIELAERVLHSFNE